MMGYAESINIYVSNVMFDISLAKTLQGLGVIGAFLHLLGYHLLVRKQVGSHDLSYFVINLFAGLFVFSSLFADFNMATMITQGFWIIISGKSIYTFWLRRRSERFSTDNVFKLDTATAVEDRFATLAEPSKEARYYG